MAEKDHSQAEMIVDFITGRPMPNVGAEEARQRVERFLVGEKGYLKKEIRVNVPITVAVAGDTYASVLDLLVSIENRTVMVVKCAAGSLESREREVVSAARILEDLPLLRAVVSDGNTAVIYDPVSGKKIAEGLDRIPSRQEAMDLLSGFHPQSIPDTKQEKEKIIFRSYDSMNVNVCRKL